LAGRAHRHVAGPGVDPAADPPSGARDHPPVGPVVGRVRTGHLGHRDPVGVADWVGLVLAPQDHAAGHDLAVLGERDGVAAEGAAVVHPLDFVLDRRGVVAGPGEDGVDRLDLFVVGAILVAVDVGGHDHL